MPEPGDVLGERFVVEDILGRGGMGVVYRVREGEEAFALKLIKPERAHQPGAARRMAREAEVLQSLQSPHVARIVESGELDGATYLLMELVEGETLRQRLAEDKTLPVAIACEIVMQATAALAPAHAAGVVHRDLKPSNLMLAERDGELWVTVLDFGIAKVLSTALDDPTLTSTGSTMGSPRYMSPEQLRDAKAVDARSDVWALGVLLYEMLAGHPPFEAPTHEALCLAIGMDEHRPLTERGHPEALAAVVDRCLDKDRIDRYLNVAELARELVPFAPDAEDFAMQATRCFDVGEDTETSDPPPPSETAEERGRALSHAGLATTLSPPRTPSRWPLYVAGALAIGAFVFATRDGAEPAPAALPVPETAAPEPPAAAPSAEAPAEELAEEDDEPASVEPPLEAASSATASATAAPTAPAIRRPRPKPVPEMRDDPLDDRR